MKTSPTHWPQVYLCVALTTLATLLLELSLTRIFSVVFYYNLAFLAISIALFGLATAAGIALRHPDREKAAFAAATFGVLLVILIDCLTVDAMTTIEVSAYFWMLLGVVGCWGQEDRIPLYARWRQRRGGALVMATGALT